MLPWSRRTAGLTVSDAVARYRGTTAGFNLERVYGMITSSNMAIVPTLNGDVDVYASNLGNLVLDIFSYFAPNQPIDDHHHVAALGNPELQLRHHGGCDGECDAVHLELKFGQPA